MKEPLNGERNLDKMEARYQSAQTLIQGAWNRDLVLNDQVHPHWIEGSESFWYLRNYRAKNGRSSTLCKEYRLVDTVASINRPAFNHKQLAEALENAATQDVDPENLPIDNLMILLSPLLVEFTAFDRFWIFDPSSQLCREKVMDTISEEWEVSPNGQLAVFIRGYNLWVCDLNNGEEQPLTSDGDRYYTYGALSSAWGFKREGKIQACWSPDSTKLFTIQVDTRQVKTTPVVHHVPLDGSLRPKVEQVKISYPGDKHVEENRLVVIDIASRDQQEAYHKTLPTCSNANTGGFFSERLGWWAKDSKRIYFIDQERDHSHLRIIEFNIYSAETRVLIEESSDTHINIYLYAEDLPPYIYLPDTEELIWSSERSGWAHLYLYDMQTGTLKNPITQGKWRVRDVLHYNTATREILIQTASRVPKRDPYYLDICRVNIDNGKITTLCSSDDEFTVCSPNNNYGIGGNISGVSPKGEYVVTTRSRADRIPVSLLINKNGNIQLELETADVSCLPKGWRWPEPFQFIGADSITDLYGLMFRPSSFSDDHCYPVINFMTGSMITPAVLKGSFTNGKPYCGWMYLQAAALAELGFIVIIIDSRGTALRSKSFQDYSYGWLASCCDTEDHYAGLCQLGRKYPFMDLSRVGIYGPGGYPGAIDNLLRRPDVYSVGVINMAQDARIMPSSHIGDKCEGRKNAVPYKAYPEELIEQFNGKLLLTHPMLDPDQLPAATFRLVEALQKFNKDFDMLMLPTLGHDFCGYQLRRGWDYFVENLMGERKPKEFKLTLTS